MRDLEATLVAREDAEMDKDNDQVKISVNCRDN
jgi:hypothetical protein